MSNLETTPDVTLCHPAADDRAVAQLYTPRAVPLGGLRGIQVDRLMPQRALPTVGAWCFLDHFGPSGEPMRVLPHPHIGLQTVTWLLAGEVRHRDSVGSDVTVRAGQLNLMTAGRGVVHSEFGADDLLHGLQLWVALPSSHAETAPAFEQHVDLPRYTADGLEATVLIGALGGAVSPASAYTPLLGAELTVGGTATVPLRPDFEHAVLAVDGDLDVAGTLVPAGSLLYLGTARSELSVSGQARAMLLGGEPFPDDLVMWWNFVGRGHEEIVDAREAWKAADTSRFGTVAGHGDQRIPAPGLPGVRLTPRRRRR
jgi:redox-sensitive bicupin YhaK (pirin superfamily)